MLQSAPAAGFLGVNEEEAHELEQIQAPRADDDENRIWLEGDEEGWFLDDEGDDDGEDLELDDY
jgi:hypothetical protein